ncbi:MAG: spermidine/putrescine ABC transporter substrate-binding protein [Planctomycetes bacterium]|nr:spermidine/putrescine ABC transporter substrate-binding protein [Planctomycetota bacterium]
MMRLLSLILLMFVMTAVHAADGKQITVYMYSEYIDPAIPKQFEQATGIAVRIDVYEAQEEMLAKLRAGGAAQYDVVVASDVIVPAMITLGLVRRLDQAKIPNRANVDAQFVDPEFDIGNVYSWPYQWGTVGLLYKKGAVDPKMVSWGAVFDPVQQPGPFVLMDEMRTQLALALHHLGKPMNSRSPADLKAAGDLLITAKHSRKCLGFDGGVGAKNKVMAGEATIAVVYNGDAVRAMAEDPQLDFIVPSEGGVIAVDNLLISSGAPNPDGAHAFIDYILDAKVGAQLSLFNHYATPNRVSRELLPKPELANYAIYPPERVMRVLQYLEDLGPATKLYDEVWTAVKSR